MFQTEVQSLSRINLYCRGDRGGICHFGHAGERTEAETGRYGGGERAKSHEYYNGGSFILYTIGISQKDQDLISLLT